MSLPAFYSLQKTQMPNKVWLSTFQVVNDKILKPLKNLYREGDKIKNSSFPDRSSLRYFGFISSYTWLTVYLLML